MELIGYSPMVLTEAQMEENPTDSTETESSATTPLLAYVMKRSVPKRNVPATAKQVAYKSSGIIL